MNLRRPHPSMRHREFVIPVVSKRGIKHVEESLQHTLKRVGIVIVEDRCVAILPSSATRFQVDQGEETRIPQK